VLPDKGQGGKVRGGEREGERKLKGREEERR